MYRQREASLPEVEVEVVEDGDVVVAGERLQPCVWGGGGRGWVRLLGRDGSGTVTAYGHWPLRSGALCCAPFAVALDAVPGPERFWLEHVPPEGAPTAVSLPGGQGDGVGEGWRFFKAP